MSLTPGKAWYEITAEANKNSFRTVICDGDFTDIICNKCQEDTYCRKFKTDREWFLCKPCFTKISNSINSYIEGVAKLLGEA